MAAPILDDKGVITCIERQIISRDCKGIQQISIPNSITREIGARSTASLEMLVIFIKSLC